MRSRCCVAIGVCWLSTACFDVEQVDVLRGVEVDDFEDGDELASSESGFGDWWCSSYSTGEGQQPPATCGLSAGFESTFAESMTFSLHETSSADYPGAVLGVAPVLGTLDLSSFRAIRFKAKLETGEPAPPDGTRLLIDLKCSTAHAPTDEGDPNLSLTYHGEPTEGVELPHDWSSYALPFVSFRQNQYQTALDDERSCVALVDTLQFRIEAALTVDGQAAAGTLSIDDVYLE